MIDLTLMVSAIRYIAITSHCADKLLGTPIDTNELVNSLIGVPSSLVRIQFGQTD